MNLIVKYGAAVLLLLGCNREPALPVSVHFDLVRLGDGIYACIHKNESGKGICNVGIVDLGDKTVVFDSFLSPQVAGEIPEVVDQLGFPPIAYVVNSHWHNDHIRGNQVFADKVQIISTLKTRELIEQNEPEEIAAEKNYAPANAARYDSLLQAFQGDTTTREYTGLKMMKLYFESMVESFPILRTRLPDLPIEESISLEGSKRKVELITLGKGHTDSDLVLYLPEEKIVFAGDLVFKELHPYLPDGYPGAWIRWMDHLDSLGVKTVVPGHGPVGTAADLQEMKNYIQMIRQQAERIIQQGGGAEQIATLEIPAPYTNWWFPNFFPTNVKFVFGKLSSEYR